jgi:hypothetical protein
MPDIDMGGGRQFDAPNGGITQDEHDKNLAQSIEMREQEVYQYQVNINNFESMITALGDLPTQWPAHLVQYRGLTRDQMAVAIEDDDELDVASGLAFRDELKARIRSEKMEQRKSKMVLDTLVAGCSDIDRIRAKISEIKASRTTA